MLAEGGFATVYRGRQLNIDRPVAVKVLNITDDPEVQELVEEKFFIEARSSAQIQHPNVVTIFDYGLVGSTRQPFIVMELLEGRHLGRDLFAEGPMSPSRAFRLLLPCLGALAEAHRLGIVHRDLKPANLFIVHPGTERELLKVLDFGVARLWAMQAISKTGNGQLLGSPRYLAPEYLSRNIATPALDVYQMGLIILEMLTGKPVIDAVGPFECIWHHTHGALSIPVDLMEGPLQPVLLKALEMDYEVRYPNAGALRRALLGIDIDKIERPGPHTRTLASFTGGANATDPAAPPVDDPSADPAVVRETVALRRHKPSDFIPSVHEAPTSLVPPPASRKELAWLDESTDTEDTTPAVEPTSALSNLDASLDPTSLVSFPDPKEVAPSLAGADEDSLEDQETTVWGDKFLQEAGLRPPEAPSPNPEPKPPSPKPKAQGPKPQPERRIRASRFARDYHPLGTRVADEEPSPPARETLEESERRHSEGLRAKTHIPVTPVNWTRLRPLVITGSFALGGLLFITAVVVLVLVVFFDVSLI